LTDAEQLLKPLRFYVFILRSGWMDRGANVSDEFISNVHWLVKSVTRGLLSRRLETPEIGEVLERLAEQNLEAAAFRPPRPRALPVCSILPDVVGAALPVASDVAAAIAAVEDDLHWKQNPNYSDEAMGAQGYMDGYAYAEIIGPTGFFPGDDFLLGLLLLAPGQLYREHYHAAPELYWMLTGPSSWKRGAGGWEQVEAGFTRWHKPFVVHATETANAPLLCLWAWTRNTAEPARLVEPVRSLA
jgi:hypothetical protein